MTVRRRCENRKARNHSYTYQSLSERRIHKRPTRCVPNLCSRPQSQEPVYFVQSSIIFLPFIFCPCNSAFYSFLPSFKKPIAFVISMLGLNILPLLSSCFISSVSLQYPTAKYIKDFLEVFIISVYPSPIK